MAVRRCLPVFVLLAFTPRFEGDKLNIGKIGASTTQGPQNQDRGNSTRASLAIDGRIMTTSPQSNLLSKSQCAASKTSSSVRSWLQIDLQSVYLINRVVVTFYGITGRQTIIRVGSSTSSDGNDNLLCGTVEDYADQGRKAIQRTVTCTERLWGRYVNLQRPTTGTDKSTGNLEICEVEIYNKLDVGILYNQSNVNTMYVNEAGDLPQPILCGVSPDMTGYNDALKLNWRRAGGTSIPLLTSSRNTISQNSSGQQELYVKNVSVDEEGWYVCEYTIPYVNQTRNASLQILVNVDCGWSKWGDCSVTCGVGSRRRLPNNPPKQHRGKVCKGLSVENCTDLPPCPPSIRNFTTTRQVDEGGSLDLRCEAQMPNLQSIDQTVIFQWAKYGKDGKKIPILGNDGRKMTASYQDPNRLHFFYGTLQLNPVSRLDSGSYTCRISGSVGSSRYSSDSIKVNVKFAPENVVLRNVPMVAVKGQSVTFNCTADGNPSPTYKWLKDRKPVRTKQTFSIGSVSYASAGVYVCVVTNIIKTGWKTDNASAVLKVQGPPQNCSILSAESCSSSSFTLAVKCFNGNSPITGYLLRFKKRTSSEWETRNITANNDNEDVENLLLKGLEDNTQYDTQVKARNTHGYESGSGSFSITKRVRTAEKESCDCQSPICTIAGVVGAVNAILLIALLAAVKILLSRKGHPKSYKNAKNSEDDTNADEEATQMTNSALYGTTKMAPLPHRALTSDSKDEDETCNQESEDPCHNYEELPTSKKETSEI